MAHFLLQILSSFLHLKTLQRKSLCFEAWKIFFLFATLFHSRLSVDWGRVGAYVFVRDFPIQFSSLFHFHNSNDFFLFSSFIFFVMSENYCCLKSTILSITCDIAYKYICIYRRELLHNYFDAFNLIFIYFYVFISLHIHTHTRARVNFLFYSNSQGKSVAEENFHQSAILQQQHQQRKMTKCLDFLLFQCLFPRSIINDLILFTSMHNFSWNFSLFLAFCSGNENFHVLSLPSFCDANFCRNFMRFSSNFYAIVVWWFFRILSRTFWVFAIEIYSNFANFH